MSKNVIAQLEVHRDSTINNIEVEKKYIEELKHDILVSLNRLNVRKEFLNVRKEFLKELNAAIEKLKDE